MLASICVYCGAQRGADPGYADAAARLGRALAARGIRLVYGGGSVGLMGIVADAVLAGGGRVTGVIPRWLASAEVAHRGLDDLVLVESMHERKRVMFDRSEAFIALPGGFGTLDELFEMVTWRQLGRHERPIVLANVRGFFDGLIAHVEHAVREGFIPERLRGLVVVARDVEEALALAGA
jgi:hypothetical protein